MYLIREIVGWLLVIVALFMVYTGLGYAAEFERPRVVEAGIVLFAGLGVLRAGILLIRISTAARICQSNLPPEK